MGKNGFLAFIFAIFFVSTSCDASLVFHLRKLIATEPNNGSTTSQVSPIGSPANESKTNPINAGKSEEEKQKEGKSEDEKQKESQIGNQTNSNGTLPIDSKGSNKDDNSNKTSGAPNLPAGERNGSTVDTGNEKATNETAKKLDKNGSCEGSLTSCRDQEMLACIESSKDGSKERYLVVQNEGEITLKVTVQLPNYLENDLPAFEVPKHKTKRTDISSTVGKSTKLIVNSGNGKCVLQLVNPVSVDNIIQQVSFYSKQVNPIYLVYASFVLALLFGGTWACCKFSKRNHHRDGIPYQELEMGLPECASGANVGATESWDHDWDDDDDWDAVKSPSGNQVRSVSANGLSSRSPKKDGWEDWED